MSYIACCHEKQPVFVFWEAFVSSISNEDAVTDMSLWQK